MWTTPFSLSPGFARPLRAGHESEDSRRDSPSACWDTRSCLSALAVVISFAALLSVHANELRSIATGGLLAVGISAEIATTLLPGVARMARHTSGCAAGAILSDALGTRARCRPVATQWGRVAATHPWRVLALGGVPLLCLGSQAAPLEFESTRWRLVPPLSRIRGCAPKPGAPWARVDSCESTQDPARASTRVRAADARRLGRDEAAHRSNCERRTSRIRFARSFR